MIQCSLNVLLHNKLTKRSRSLFSRLRKNCPPMACPMIHSVHYLACLPHTLYLAMIRHCVYKTGIRWTPVILSQILRHWFSLCFADASVKHDACYLFKNTVLLMKKSGLLIEFKSDDVMKITFWNMGFVGIFWKNKSERPTCQKCAFQGKLSLRY